MAVLKSKGVFMAGRADGIFCKHLSHRIYRIRSITSETVKFVEISSFISLGSLRPSPAGPKCTSGLNKVGRGCEKAKKLSGASCI